MFKAYTDDVCADKTLPMDSKDCPQGRKALEHIKTHIYIYSILKQCIYPIRSMYYGIFTYIWLVFMDKCR